MKLPAPLSHSDYTVACICPMDVELAPVQAMLDKTHPRLPTERGENSYTLGEIGGHNVVVAFMPRTGNNHAAVVATQLLNDFPSITVGLLVGIGAGVPSEEEDRNELRCDKTLLSEALHLITQKLNVVNQ
jgi:nucleoside phosphorylase